MILDDIWSVVARCDVDNDDIGIADGQSSSGEGRHRFAVRMHDIGEPICYLVQFAADNFRAVADADKQTAAARICKGADGGGEVPFVWQLSLNSRLSDSPPWIRLSRFSSLSSISTPELGGVPKL